MLNRISAASAFLILLLAMGCSKDETVPAGPDCTQTPLTTPTATVTNASSCTASDGQISVTAAGGVAPYTYSINGGAFQPSEVFSGLTAGTFPIVVKDSRGCTKDFEATVSATGSTLNFTANTVDDTECFAPHNGSIEIIPTGGTPPYEIKFGTSAFGAATSFTGLAADDYVVIVKDADGCTQTKTIGVEQGDTGVSFATDILPIITANCAINSNCHGAGASQPVFTTYAVIKTRAANIKVRTANGTMPPAGQPDLTANQIQLIACWVDSGAPNN